MGIDMALEKDILIELKNVSFSYYQEPEASDAPDGGDDDVSTCAPASSDADDSYCTPDGPREERRNALDDISLTVKKGELLAIIGANGSGKSTLAKMLNALLVPNSGTVIVKGMSVLDDENIWEIRRAVGMVFQNPDNQIVGTTVEEDVAFGVENIGVEPSEIRTRIDSAMKATGVYELANRPPYQLSGGQKQRVAIAGILAMKPDCIVLDEATAMLDPDGRKEVLSIVRELNEKESISVVIITHHMDEAGLADRVIVMNEGRVISDVTPRQLFGDIELVRSMGLEAPEITELFDILRKRGVELPKGVVGVDEAYQIIREAMQKTDVSA
jgi:energy-coupling factor transport system ATP-binding protein